MFVSGSMAKEESLCHEEILFGVLNSERRRELFYKKHKTMLNRALYHSDLLYSTDILFVLKDNKVYADIITCAAPNRKAAQKYQMVSDEEVSKAMNHRITSILQAAYEMKADILILGAFGCGVFGNFIPEVSYQFQNKLTHEFKNCFQRVVFTVPDAKSYYAMERI